MEENPLDPALQARVAKTLQWVDSLGATEAERRDEFCRIYWDFAATHKLPERVPTLGHQELDLYHAFRAVVARGGADVVTSTRAWKFIVSELKVPESCTNSSFSMRQGYTKMLGLFEENKMFGKEIPVDVEADSARRSRRPARDEDDDTEGGELKRPRRSSGSWVQQGHHDRDPHRQHQDSWSPFMRAADVKARGLGPRAGRRHVMVSSSGRYVSHGWTSADYVDAQNYMPSVDQASMPVRAPLTILAPAAGPCSETGSVFSLPAFPVPDAKAPQVVREIPPMKRRRLTADEERALYRKISLSIESGIPSEVRWALNTCVMLSTIPQQPPSLILEEGLCDALALFLASRVRALAETASHNTDQHYLLKEWCCVGCKDDPVRSLRTLAEETRRRLVRDLKSVPGCGGDDSALLRVADPKRSASFCDGAGPSKPHCKPPSSSCPAKAATSPSPYLRLEAVGGKCADHASGPNTEGAGYDVRYSAEPELEEDTADWDNDPLRVFFADPGTGGRSSQCDAGDGRESSVPSDCRDGRGATCAGGGGEVEKPGRGGAEAAPAAATAAQYGCLCGPPAGAAAPRDGPGEWSAGVRGALRFVRNSVMHARNRDFLARSPEGAGLVDVLCGVVCLAAAAATRNDVAWTRGAALSTLHDAVDTLSWVGAGYCPAETGRAAVSAASKQASSRGQNVPDFLCSPQGVPVAAAVLSSSLSLPSWDPLAQRIFSAVAVAVLGASAAVGRVRGTKGVEAGKGDETGKVDEDAMLPLSLCLRASVDAASRMMARPDGASLMDRESLETLAVSVSMCLSEPIPTSLSDTPTPTPIACGLSLLSTCLSPRPDLWVTATRSPASLPVPLFVDDEENTSRKHVPCPDSGSVAAWLFASNVRFLAPLIAVLAACLDGVDPEIFCAPESGDGESGVAGGVVASALGVADPASDESSSLVSGGHPPIFVSMLQRTVANSVRETTRSTLSAPSNSQSNLQASAPASEWVWQDSMRLAPGTPPPLGFFDTVRVSCEALGCLTAAVALAVRPPPAPVLSRLQLAKSAAQRLRDNTLLSLRRGRDTLGLAVMLGVPGAEALAQLFTMPAFTACTATPLSSRPQFGASPLLPAYASESSCPGLSLLLP
eukprot:Rmarinus@m.23291